MTEAPPPPVAARPLAAAEDKQWASYAHFGGVIGPIPALIIFLIFKTRGELTRVESKEALNWQITFVVGWIALSLVGTAVSFAFYGLGIYVLGDLLGFLPLLWWVLNAVLSVLGGVMAQGGGSYRYPFALRLVK